MKLYTLDEKLLCERPEIRIQDKVYPVDDRQKTVQKVSKIDTQKDGGTNEVLKLALGARAAKEIDEMNLPFPAYLKLVELVIAAMTGEEPEAVSERFQTVRKSQ